MESKQKNLIAKYRKLSPACQQVVQVLAVHGDSVNRTDLVPMANKKGVRDADGNRLVYKEFRQQLTAIIDSDVIQFERNQNGPVVTHPKLIDFGVQEAFLAGNLKTYAEAGEKEHGRRRFYYHEKHWIRELRIAFYLGDEESWNESLEQILGLPNLLFPLRIEVVERLKPNFRALWFGEIVHQLIHAAITIDPKDLHQYREILLADGKLSQRSIAAFRDLYVAQGDLDGLRLLAEQSAPGDAVEASGLFLQGDYDAALNELENSLKAYRKQTKKRTAVIPFLPAILYMLLLLRDNSAKSLKKVKAVARKIEEWSRYNVYASCAENVIANLNDPNMSVYLPHPDSRRPESFCLATGWFWRWFDSENKPPFTLAQAESTGNRYRKNGLLWFAAEMEAITASAANFQTNGKKSKAKATRNKKPSPTKSKDGWMQASTQTHQQLGTTSLIDFIRPLPKWEKMLSAVESMAQSTKGNAAGVATNDALLDERIVWELQYSRFDEVWLHLTPYLQKHNAKGWTKGRKVALSRLYGSEAGSNFDCLSEHDKRICSAVCESTDRNHYGYRETVYYWDPDRLAETIVGHPNIFREGDRRTPLEITAESPGLAVIESSGNIKLSVTPDPGGESVVIDERGANRITLVRFDKKQQKLASMIAHMPPIPKAQRERVGAVAQSLSAFIPVQSDIEGASSGGETVEPVSDIVVQLTPFQEGLRAELFVQPLGEHGPFCRPGVGSASVFAKVDGKPFSTRRNLKLEQTNMRTLLAECEPLNARTIGDEQTEWLFMDAEDALTLVTDLHERSETKKLTVLWPRGKTHDVAGSATTKQFQLSVKKDRDWFAASGKLQVDDELTLDMMRLLELASASPSRFVQLDDGRYLALTMELRKRIDEIAAYGSVAKGKVRFSPIRAVVMDEHVEATAAKTDKHWKDHIDRIEQAATLKTAVPSTLQANLRNYQEEGYGWMTRLAHWNTGACLADDMGLGKTVQALALLIDRSQAGPSLVVAPASVGFNWEHEAYKFAPTLTTKLFRNWDRDEFFQSLGPGDVAITSYGLLQSEIDRFAEVKWGTILLDEAQAIKNMDTKRSQAVMKLQGDFRLILTGTPLENHLGEMWNLFRFITPGLLGSHDDFRKRFALPIERDQCRETRNRLKKLIQPFLLRRTKSEVLSELPPRSESLIEIEISAEEAALYEAVRQRALEKLSGSKEASEASNGSKKGQQHLQVLAELTRLRLACCHPSFVGGKGIESSKLRMFRQKITEVIEGQHKVLVFSQFVKHLAILRDELDAMNVSYQYLDGSTPAKRRKDIVNAFQSGEGDVFLISLKAGGTGLNLTAADYVMHMDPWWNPAVEDQATDRAHRIGQNRPVHVYRFIAKGTIEEKIVALHETKRDLADSLLSGSNIASKLSTEDLIKLLKEA